METNVFEDIQEVALLLPDYESLYSGMAHALHDRERVVQEYFEEAAHITGLDITRLLFTASVSELRSLPEAYIVLFLVHAATDAYIRSKGITITQVGGYGLGVYGALHAARAYTFADGLYLVSKWAAAYAELLHEKNFKKISVSPIRLKALHKVLSTQDKHQVALSEKIADDVFLVSGVRSAVELCEEALLPTHPDVVIVELPLESGLYAPLDVEKSAVFGQYLEKVEFKDTEIPCFNPHTSGTLQTARQIKEFISKQPFLFQDRVQLIDQFADCPVLVAPFADKPLLEQLRARYPEKNIITEL